MIKKVKISITYIDQYGQIFESDEFENWKEFESNLSKNKRKIETLIRQSTK